MAISAFGQVNVIQSGQIVAQSPSELTHINCVLKAQKGVSLGSCNPSLRSFSHRQKLDQPVDALRVISRIARRRFMSIVRDRTSTPIRTLLADPDSGDRARGREVSCRLHEHQRCVTRKPRPTAWVNGSIKVPQPQRGVTRIPDSEFRPFGASNRLGSKSQAAGLGYRVTHLRC